MRRFNYDFTASVSIDGTARDQRTIWAHQQQDPYPGGHRYEVIFRGASVHEYLHGLPLDVTTRLDAATAHNLLERIRWALEAPEEAIAWEFVLNTIDAVQTTSDTVSISGECSPFVRS